MTMLKLSQATREKLQQKGPEEAVAVALIKELEDRLESIRYALRKIYAHIPLTNSDLSEHVKHAINLVEVGLELETGYYWVKYRSDKRIAFWSASTHYFSIGGGRFKLDEVTVLSDKLEPPARKTMKIEKLGVKMNKERLEELQKSWPECEYWDFREDAETLSHDNLLEALEHYIGYHLGPNETWEQLPDTIKLYGWKRKKVDTESLTNIAYDAIKAEYSEEYGDPEEDYGQPPAELWNSLTEAIDMAFKGHEPWRCERTEVIELTRDEVISIAKLEWPEWFEEEEKNAD